MEPTAVSSPEPAASQCPLFFTDNIPSTAGAVKPTAVGSKEQPSCDSTFHTPAYVMPADEAAQNDIDVQALIGDEGSALCYHFPGSRRFWPRSDQA